MASFRPPTEAITLPSQSWLTLQAAISETTMAIRSFTESEVTARARQLADKEGPGWQAVMDEEHIGKDTTQLRHWLQRALEDLEAEEATGLEIEADAPNTVGLD
jgi:hypothetical protein